RRLEELRASLVRDSYQRHLVHQAVGEHPVAVARDVHVAHDVAAAGNRPALELLRVWIEAHHRVRARFRLAVPEYALDRRDAVRRGLGAARRLPLLDLTGL